MDEVAIKLDQPQLDQITQMGIFGYPAAKVMILMDVTNEAEFLRAFNDPTSAVSKAYQKGVHKADFMLDIALWKKANTGDMEALKRFQNRKEMRLNKQKPNEAF